MNDFGGILLGALDVKTAGFDGTGVALEDVAAAAWSTIGPAPGVSVPPVDLVG